MTNTSNERRAQRTAGHMQRLVERDLMSSIAASQPSISKPTTLIKKLPKAIRKECSHNCFCQKRIWSVVRAKFRLGSISLVKSAAISFGGMVFECLEIGVFEALLFMSSFLLTVLWIGLRLAPNKSRCLFAINLFLQTAWFDAGRPVTTTNKEQRISSKQKATSNKEEFNGFVGVMLGLLVWC